MARSRSIRSPKGISLIEVVCSIAILAVAVTLTVRAFSHSVRATETSRDLTEAVFIAANEMAQIERAEKLPDQNHQSMHEGRVGSFDTAWTIEEDPQSGLRSVASTVAWSAPAGRRSLEVETLLSKRKERP